jgi:SAM-dependent methyltransferase
VVQELDQNMAEQHAVESPGACRLCRAEQMEPLLDFGLQPICNRFLASADETEATFPLRLGQCRACGVVQATACPPAAELRPRFDWITYNEPEGHLDRLADTIAALPGLTKNSTICGVSFKDDSLLRRLGERGFARRWRIGPAGDLGVQEPGTGVETIQDRLDAGKAAEIADRRGQADVVIARHIWEHAFDPAGFLRALQQIMAPTGHIVLEIPDCERALASCDYTTVWEEHTLYFTPATFRHGILLAGLSISHYELVPYSLENSLIAVARRSAEVAPAPLDSALLESERRRATMYSRGLAPQRERTGASLAGFRKEQGKIAVLGAGHLACTYVNLLDLKEHIDFLVDDNPHKRGLYMPGSRLPICGSRALVDRAARLCLLSVSPESEDRVMQRNREFTAAGGRFASLFPASKYALKS